jgi:hypothetical protein
MDALLRHATRPSASQSLPASGPTPPRKALHPPPGAGPRTFLFVVIAFGFAVADAREGAEESAGPAGPAGPASPDVLLAGLLLCPSGHAASAGPLLGLGWAGSGVRCDGDSSGWSLSSSDGGSRPSKRIDTDSLSGGGGGVRGGGSTGRFLAVRPGVAATCHGRAACRPTRRTRWWTKALVLGLRPRASSVSTRSWSGGAAGGAGLSGPVVSESPSSPSESAGGACGVP